MVAKMKGLLRRLGFLKPRRFNCYDAWKESKRVTVTPDFEWIWILKGGVSAPPGIEGFFLEIDRYKFKRATEDVMPIGFWGWR